MKQDTTEEICDVSRFLWIGLPVAGIALMLLSPIIVNYDIEVHRVYIARHEFSIIELQTVLFCLVASLLAFLTFFLRRNATVRPMPFFLVLAALAALFFGGEEASWGQHYFGWKTPDSISKVNAQDETNLHNISNAFNNVPRQIMRISCIVGGLILPLVLIKQLADPKAPSSFWYWLLPNYRVVPIAALASFWTLPKHLDLMDGESPDGYLRLALKVGSGEFLEWAFAATMMLYCISIWKRAGRRSSETTSTEDRRRLNTGSTGISI